MKSKLLMPIGFQFAKPGNYAILICTNSHPQQFSSATTVKR
jgi:hypothetical protein